MARDSQIPAIGASNLEATESSEDLLKSAWASMGRTDTGDRVEEDDLGSASGTMTSAANRSSTQSTADAERALTAEEIARMLNQETARRGAATQQRPSRTEPPPLPQPESRTQARPRRAAPTAAPPSSTPTAPQPRPAPQPQRTSDGQEPARRRRGIGWGIFVVFWLVASFVGSFLENSDSGTPDVTIEVPDVTIDFSDLTSTSITVDGGATAVNIRDLEPGTCIDSLPLGDIVSDVATVPCGLPHQYELYANTQLVGDNFPTDEVFDLAFDACSVLFFDYVGETYATSSWYVDVIAPTEDGWTTANDRTVNCLLYEWNDAAGEVEFVTGTAEGSGDSAG